jgi:hypothetical protein
MTYTARTCGRRRCCECRSWYVPAASAAKFQKTCSKKCRLRRRSKQAKRRREEDLANARADECERQRKHRCQEREKSATGPPLSRAGLPAQVVDCAEEILANLRQVERLSRAGLRRRMRREVLKTLSELYREGENLGQDRWVSRTGLEGQVAVVVGESP